MNTFGILMGQMELMAIYMAIGVVLVKTGVLDHDSLGVVARFVLKLALPVMLFSNTVSGMTREILIDCLPVLYLTMLLYILIFGVALGLAKLFCLKGDRAKVYRAMSMFGNVGFMGIPIMISIFQENGAVYVSVFTIVDQLVLWTIGVQLTSPSGKSGFELKNMMNPATVAVVLSVLLVACGLSLPGSLETALSKTGATATPLAMIYLGGLFACVNVKEYIRKKELYGIVLGKMCLFPVLFYLVTNPFPIAEEIHLAMALMAAMPTMSSLVMMAKSSGGEGDYAMGGIFVTTLCSLVTLPAVCWFLQNVTG